MTHSDRTIIEGREGDLLSRLAGYHENPGAKAAGQSPGGIPSFEKENAHVRLPLGPRGLGLKWLFLIFVLYIFNVAPHTTSLPVIEMAARW